MPRARRNPRSRSRRSRGRRGGGHIGDEFFTFSLQVGTSVTLTVSQLTTLPKNCNFRPLFMAVECTTAYGTIQANGDGSGFMVPSALDCQLIDSGNKVVSASRPITLGASPRKIWTRYPRSGDWFPSTSPSSTNIGRMTAICLGGAGGNRPSYIRGVVHIKFVYSYEILDGRCPAYNHYTWDESPQRPLMWWEEVELEYPSYPPTRQEGFVEDVRRPSGLTESSPSVVIEIQNLETPSGSSRAHAWSIV